MSQETSQTDLALRKACALVSARARQALGASLERTVPGVSLDGRGYTLSLEENLLPGITRSEIEAEFTAGAGNELAGKMQAPWSSAVLAVNAFVPWRKSVSQLSLNGIQGFTSLDLEKQCPNGVSRIPPHLDVLLSHDSQKFGVESKCMEFLTVKRTEVSPRYCRLKDKGDRRAASKWFEALANVHEFRLLDAYQLIKHYLGLAHEYPNSPLTLVYIFWEPANADQEPVFAQHRRELIAFSLLVQGDVTCSFKWLPYAEHWRELQTLSDAPIWLGEHLKRLQARYLVNI